MTARYINLHFTYLLTYTVTKFQKNPLGWVVKCRRWENLTIFPFISKTVGDRLVVTMEH